MMFRSISLLVFLCESAAAADDSSGSYWVQYDGDAPQGCVVPDGDMVDDACCTDSSSDPFFIKQQFELSCFVIRGFLGEEGGSLQSYLGCDDGVPTYGEGCYNDGANGGLIPPGEAGPDDTNAPSIGDCGCTFQVSGNGCHKIRDFSALPGFENDTRQVFLYMNETCDDGDDVDDSSSVGGPAVLGLAWLAFVAAASSFLVAL